MDFYIPTRLYCGEGCLARHGEKIAALGKSCMIVTGRHAARASGALADLQKVLKSQDVRSVVWDGVSENPPILACTEAGLLGAREKVDFVIGVGGGSALDAAKAVAVFSANPTLTENRFYAFDWEQDPLPIVLVGTTAGTGSEVTKVSVLTDSHRRKHSIHDDRLYAALSFGDSAYTRTCSALTMRSCGVDVLAHAMESYFSRKADEVSRAFAVRAIRLAFEPLRLLGDDAKLGKEDWRDLYEASILAGLAINTTGTCFPHNVGYYLTENYGVAHGFASAAFLPRMLDVVGDYDPDYAHAFYDEVGRDEAAICELLSACLPRLNVRMSTEEIDAALPRWDGNGSVLNTRAEVSLDALRAMLVEMFCE